MNNNIEEKRISFKTAKLAKEKGYTFSAPTQSLLQKWLREKHNIQVYAYSYSVKGNKNGGKSFSDYIYVVNSLNDSKVIQSDVRDELYQTYEEALEEGLQKALELIK